jgi:hypothetical protein
MINCFTSSRLAFDHENIGSDVLPVSEPDLPWNIHKWLSLVAERRESDEHYIIAVLPAT